MSKTINLLFLEANTGDNISKPNAAGFAKKLASHRSKCICGLLSEDHQMSASGRKKSSTERNTWRCLTDVIPFCKVFSEY